MKAPADRSLDGTAPSMANMTAIDYLESGAPSLAYTPTPLKKYVVFNVSENGEYAYPLEKFVFDLNIQFSRG